MATATTQIADASDSTFVVVVNVVDVAAAYGVASTILDALVVATTTVVVVVVASTTTTGASASATVDIIVAGATCDAIAANTDAR